LEHDPAAFVVDRLTCSALQMPGAAGQPSPSTLIPVASLMIRPAPARCR
jgi:hypothetical protein